MRAQEVVAPCSQGQDRVASTSRAAQQTASRVLGAPDSRATAESRRAAARLLHNPPAAREVVNVREQGHRRRDHDEAVKMEDGQLFPDKEAREVRFVQALVRSAGDGLVEPGE